MSDYLLQFVAGNLLVSSLLAAAAWVAQARLRRPMVAHLLWTLALIKLLTPPLFTVPVVPLPGDAAAPPSHEPAGLLDTAPITGSVDLNATLPLATDWLPDIGSVVVGLWLLGSAVVLVWSLLRVARFQRLLRQSRTTTPPALTAQLAALAHRFELSRVPALHLTTARLTPMVWWTGGRVQIYMPAAMVAEMPIEQLRWILAHEIGHVRRGDHLVRWIEWLTCVAFWWNPITWWARRNLRANEEVCCDALVLRTLQGSRHSYADSLLTAVEFLASPGLRPPAMASEINSGGILQKRFAMIVSKTPVKTTPRWLQGAFAAAAALLMPLGVAYAQNPDVKAVAERLERAVKAGELSKKEMSNMLGALKKSTTKQGQQNRDRKRSDQANELEERAANLRRRLQSAVESGRFDKAEARKIFSERMAQMELEAGKRKMQSDRNELEEKAEQIRRRVRAGIESGRIQPEEGRRIARERLAELKAVEAERRNRQAQQGRDKDNAREAFRKANAEYREALRKLEAGVKNGKVEREDMARKAESYRRKLIEMEQKMKRSERAAAADRGEAARRRLAGAVERGDMTEREAKRKWAGLERGKAAGKRDQSRAALAETKKKLEVLRAQLAKEVQNGDLSKKDAQRKWNAIRKEMAAQKKADSKAGKKKVGKKKAGMMADKKRAAAMELELKEMKTKIEEAIQRGDLSKEEAEKKWAEVKKEMAAAQQARKKAGRRRNGIR